MRIKLRTRYAGPRGCFEPEQVIDLPNNEAADLINGGYATEVKAPQPTRPPPAKPAGDKPDDHKSKDEKSKEEQERKKPLT